MYREEKQELFIIVIYRFILNVLLEKWDTVQLLWCWNQIQGLLLSWSVITEACCLAKVFSNLENFILNSSPQEDTKYVPSLASV